MKKAFPLLLAAALLFACTLTPAPLTPTPPPSPTASVPASLTDTPLPTETGRYTLVYIHRYEGTFNYLLAEHARQAAALGQRPIAYFTAYW